jgi:hypothetical protein
VPLPVAVCVRVFDGVPVAEAVCVGVSGAEGEIDAERVAVCVDVSV